LCVFNMSPYGSSLELKTVDRDQVTLMPDISRGAVLDGLHLKLAPYGYAFLN